jgi:hypothetical protein
VSWFPQDIPGAGDTWINSAFLFPEGWAPGTQNFLTLLHEVGHALGLKHPHDAGLSGVLSGWPDNPTVLAFTGTDTLTAESTQTMVMAYNDIPGISTFNDLALQSNFAPTTPMRWDIAALQYLYGANMAYNAGDTVYTFDGDGRYNQTLWDGGGNDTIVATGSRAVGIDLRPGHWSKLGLPLSFSTRNADNSLNAPQPQFADPQHGVHLRHGDDRERHRWQRQRRDLRQRSGQPAGGCRRHRYRCLCRAARRLHGCPLGRAVDRVGRRCRHRHAHWHRAAAL